MTDPTTIVIQCPIPTLLQAFNCSDGSMVWRAPISAQRFENERWFHLQNGTLVEMVETPVDLCDECPVSYLSPTRVVCENIFYVRYTIVSINNECLGVLFVNEETGEFAPVDPLNIALIPNTSNSTTTPNCLLRWHLMLQTDTKKIIVKEVWGTKSAQDTRSVRYYEFGTEKLLKFEPNEEALLEPIQLKKCILESQ